MVKKIFFIFVSIYTIFILIFIFASFYIFKSEKQIIDKTLSLNQYNFYIKERYDRLELMKETIKKQYITLKRNIKKIKIKKTKNTTLQLIKLLNTLNEINYKNINIFLLNYLYNLKNNIDICNLNNTIIASTNILNVGKKVKLNCNPLKNNGQCAIESNNKYILITYVPTYKVFIKITEKLNQYNPKDFDPIINNIKNIPGIIIYYQNKKIIGSFDPNYFYVFEEFKPLKLFFGTRIKYSVLEKLSKNLNNELNKSIKPLLLRLILIYIILIVITYIVLFIFYKKEVIKLEKIFKSIQKKATYDKLTGVLNRESFEEIGKRKKHKYFIIVDLDNFKYINDTFGHDIGDYVLKEFAWQLKKHFKEDIIGRWGGDEFIILTNKSKDLIIDIINDINSKLLEIQKEFDKKLEKKLSVSAGACGAEEAPFEERFKNADLALYKVKKSKKGNVLFFKDIDYIKIEKEDLK